MRVYYLTGAQFAISKLALRRIKIARFKDLNDPSWPSVRIAD